MNRDLGMGAHATRFISLAAVGNAAKSKWVHALGLEPAANMNQEELLAKPEGATASPYVLATGSKRPAAAQPWRWGDQAPKKSKTSAEVPVDTAKSVFVRNLPFSAEAEDLEAFFTKAGEVVWRLLHCAAPKAELPGSRNRAITRT